MSRVQNGDSLRLDVLLGINNGCKPVIILKHLVPRNVFLVKNKTDLEDPIKILPK